VPDVRRETLLAARRTLARANCRVGRVRRGDSMMEKGHVISQKPKFGAVRRGGVKVNLVVSSGWRR
jgi:beta-lactam-binding protein with PASTA domain